MKVHLAAALLLTSILAGCSDGGDDDPEGDAAMAAPVLYLNVTADGQTYRYTSGSAGGNATGSASASASVSVSATGTTTASAGGNASAPKGNATKGDAPGGEAPLNVSVTLGASGLPASFTWTLDFGDSKGGGSNGTSTATTTGTGSATGTASGTTTGTATGTATGNATGTTTGAKANGTQGGQSGSKLPATVRHTYTAAGNHTIRFTLTPTGGSAVDVRTTVRVTAPALNGTGNQTGNQTGAPPPEVTHFEFGETLGCTGDLVGNTCQDYEAGPPGTGTDGHWIALGPSYWGWTLTSTVDQGNPQVNDSDCVFVDEALAEVGQANNGADACMGEVPEGAAWVFLYPYALPALGLTVDFVPTAPA